VSEKFKLPESEYPEDEVEVTDAFNIICQHCGEESNDGKTVKGPIELPSGKAVVEEDYCFPCYNKIIASQL